MFTTAIIAFREFLEVFLIIGVFLGISKKLNLKKEKEIIAAASIGITASLIIAVMIFIFGSAGRTILSEEKADFLGSYLLIFSGFFIAYVVFFLHDLMNGNRGEKLIRAREKLQDNKFDISLFFTIVFLILREGLEIALFTSSISLFYEFIQNLFGLILGFFSAAVIGASTYVAYVKVPISRIFKWTQYLIISLGASLVQNGFTHLFITHFNINLSGILPLHLQFLPEKESFVGHLLSGFFGVDREFSLARLTIMVFYIAFVYFVFLNGKKAKPRSSK